MHLLMIAIVTLYGQLSGKSDVHQNWHLYCLIMLSPMPRCLWTASLLLYYYYYSIVHRSRRLCHVLVYVWTLSFHMTLVLGFV